MSQLASFDTYIESAMKSWNCPGVALAIIRGDKVVHQKAYGFRDLEAQLPLTIDTRFALASVTKSFTAMSLALLVDEGKLEWDKPVRHYMPEFILHDPYVTEHITVRDMLSHRTGLPRHDFAAWRLDITLAEFIERMRYLKLSTSFREKFQYNNLMYYASAYLIEKLSGQAWEAFMQERIFAPLGMNASNFTPEPPLKTQLNANGYRVDRDDEGGAKGIARMPFGEHTKLSPGTAGALFSTLADLTTWLKVHVNKGQAGNFRLVTEDNLKQMHAPQTIVPTDGLSEALFGTTIFTYGLGWSIQPYKSQTLISHGGNVEGHSLMVGFIPKEEIGVVVLSNIAGLPLRDILLYESIDRTLNLDAEDWNTKFHHIVDPLIKAGAKAKQTTTEERKNDAPTSHDMERYVGTYEAKGYPDFAVKRVGDKLQACTLGSLAWSELKHYHYDVFEWHLADFDNWIKLRFLVNDNGDLDSVSIPLEPAVENIIFNRKALELPQSLINAILGQYAPAIEGLSYSIAQKQGMVYITQTGGTADELKAYLLTDKLVGFKYKETRFDFTRDKDAITQLVIKAPSITLECPRQP